MSLDAHISELRRKHEAISQMIEDEQRRPGSNDLEIGKLKREKLRLKEEIVRLAPTAH